MRRWLVLVMCLGMLVASVATAQPICRGEKTNQQGTAGADITISGGAVTIALRNTSRCALFIHNTGSEAMRCRDVTNDGTPTATAGVLFDAADEKTIEESATGLWQCFPVTTSTTANVSESVP